MQLLYRFIVFVRMVEFATPKAEEVGESIHAHFPLGRIPPSKVPFTTLYKRSESKNVTVIYNIFNIF